MRFRILYQDPYLIAIDKPAGFHVHPPENSEIRISNSSNCLALLRKQIDQFLYPVHRIDCSTSGVLLYALDPETARDLCALFRERQIHKSYICIVRGWVQDTVLDRPLGHESGSDETTDAVTRIQCLMQTELPHAVGKYTTARYSLVRAEPLTGRYHQIRRHLAGHSHPIIGDSVHGDGAHNRFFREEIQSRSLLLKAQSLTFTHPRTGAPIFIESRWNGKWHKLFDLFGLCPFRAS